MRLFLLNFCATLDHGRFPVVRGLALSRGDLVRRAVIMALTWQSHVLYEFVELAYLLEFQSYFATEMTARAKFSRII